MPLLPTDHVASADRERECRYAYKPSLMGALFEFRLAPEALEWQAGRRSGRIPYGLISRIRLSFRPMTMQSHRFVMEIWAPNAPKLLVSSTSWRTLLDQERHDADYSAFVRELHARIARSGGTPVLLAGSIGILYWPGLAVFVATTVMLVVLAFHALRTAAWSAAGIVGFFLAMFLWQAGGFFYRTRPQTYVATALPPQVLPQP
jgi:hypothetical protein